MKKYKTFALVCVLCLFLFACALTNQLQPVPQITFITVTVGPPPAYPTTTTTANDATLTPLPGQAHAMTQDALSSPDTRPRVEMITETYTPLIIFTLTSLPSFTPLPATKSAEPTLTLTTKPLCRPEYPDFCIRYNNKRNCKDWNDLGYYNFTVLEPDPLLYDKDLDGLGCEG